MAKYRAKVEVSEYNYHLYCVVVESEDFKRVWKKAYSYARNFMSMKKGEDSTMFIYFEKEIPSLRGLTDSFWAHINMISVLMHEDHLADLDRISGLEHNESDVYVIRGREA